MIEYRTKDGDVVDQIARDITGDAVSFEAIYAANPGLAAFGPVLPSGIVIVVPAIPKRQDDQRRTGTSTPVRKVVRLWGKEA